eukprot:CAMPEP_0174285506 /NCGR_PEP_ID=MMETSP0809-20121228/8907_1 /TAXON_ID=73025 ORGANISM="Eutreptiella gymnastica-like, Strain CCMP1594" /NCGR_SAMPLE_ID=MMETSP0809 /ASSEMBLY_ACC=CAM_ASM_000658 /LENGTH=161 /DNA_ID=CAMNT_0015381303 /DNA_START=235 /DNA_END=721 /DNA_ORIENTATION=-
MILGSCATGGPPSTTQRADAMVNVHYAQQSISVSHGTVAVQSPKQCSFVNFAVSVGYRQQAFAMSQFVTQSSGRELTSISLSGISHIEVFLCCRLPAAVRKSSQAAKDEAMFGVLMRAYGALCPVKVTAGGHSPFVVKPKGMERQSTRSSWVQQGQRKGHK